MATYKEIKNHVKRIEGVSVETCHIADVLRDHGLTTRTAPNRIDPLNPVKPCPNGKRKAIEDTLRHFGMIP